LQLLMRHQSVETMLKYYVAQGRGASMPLGSDRNSMNWQPTPVADSQKRLAETKQRPDDEESPRAACPVCGGHLVEIHGKLCCVQCHSIVETCCD